MIAESHSEDITGETARTERHPKSPLHHSAASRGSSTLLTVLPRLSLVTLHDHT